MEERKSDESVEVFKHADGVHLKASGKGNADHTDLLTLEFPDDANPSLTSPNLEPGGGLRRPHTS